jgi:hypothetical protein
MATCEKCFYTREYDTDFKEWEKNLSFNTYQRAKIKEKHLGTLRDPNGLLHALGPRFDADRYPTESAIIKFILGIFDELLTERPSSLNLARYFLRIAWLFRTHLPNATGAAAVTSDGVALFRRDITRMSDVLNHYDGAVKSLVAARDQVAASFSDPSEADRFRQQHDEATKELSACLPGLRQTTSKLVALGDAAEGALSGSASPAAGYYTFRDFRHFLTDTRPLLSEITATEDEALTKAAGYYRKAYESGSQIKEGIAQIQTAYLIAELSRRTRDFETADAYFRTVLKLAWEIGREDGASVTTTNQANKLLEMARTQARLCHEDSARST